VFRRRHSDLSQGLTGRKDQVQTPGQLLEGQQVIERQGFIIELIKKTLLFELWGKEPFQL
jgi:hypothetical protein